MSSMDDLVQVSGVDAVTLTNMIVTSAREAVSHRGNCERLAEHVRIIGNLVEKLKGTDLMEVEATREPLDGLEEALKRALGLVQSCRDRSCLYMVAMGWTVVYQFRQIQAEIDRYLKLVPLISLVHEFRMQNLVEGLEAVEKDKRDYSLDEEDFEAHNVVLKRDRTKKDADILEKSLSRKYPDMDFHEALIEEKQKLNIELQRSRTNKDPNQCRVIEHLIDVTDNVVNVLPAKNVHKLVANEPTYSTSGYITNAKSSNEDPALETENEVRLNWQADLFGCCSEPCLSLKTFFYPCGTFSWIANVVTEGKISREQAINNLLGYSVIGGCCCYSCCIRKKLREHFDIEGGSFDDFLTHLMCCCCAMVQEQRELELRNFNGCQGRKMIPPPIQNMNP